MTNAEIARHFRDLATVMEYLGENQYKYRSYDRAADTIHKANQPIAQLDEEALQDLPGIGKAIAAKVRQLLSNGQLELLEQYRLSTPPVALQLLAIKGLSAKKVKQLTTELHLSSVGDLLHAIQENRVAKLKGYSAKSQDKLREQIMFWQCAQGQLRMPEIMRLTDELVENLLALGLKAVPTGAALQHACIASQISVLAARTPEVCQRLEDAGFTREKDGSDVLHTEHISRYRRSEEGVQEEVVLAEAGYSAWAHVISASSAAFLQQHPELQRPVQAGHEQQVFAKAELPYVPAPQRELEAPWPPIPEAALVQRKHLRGVVHAHTTWSDGSTELHDLAAACQERGFEYLTITDHSQAAGYAHGLSVERLQQQAQAIVAWNEAHPEFLVLRGSECDIMRDGRLDYDDETLAQLDIVIASVHSVLTMTREDATARLLTAIANPYTAMLGHPTGRLLLSRPGYDIDVEAVLSACAQNQVAVELNANPLRLDLDWRHIGLARELGIKISINPDAHSIAGLDVLEYGVRAAQKAGLRPEDCLNCLSAADFSAYLQQQRQQRLANAASV